MLILLLANRMEKGAFAKVAAAFALVETLRIGFDCGQDTISIKMLSRAGTIWHRSLHAALRIKTFTWLFGFALDLTLLSIFLRSLGVEAAIALALIGVSQLFWNLPINVMQARGWLHDSRFALWAICFALPVSVATAARLLPGNEAVIAYAFLEYAALTLLGLTVYWSGITHGAHLGHGRRLRRRQLALYIKRGWSVCMGQLAALAFGKFDVLLVTSFSPAARVADYLFAQRFFELSGFVVGGASSVMYANIARKTGRVVPTDAWVAAAKQWARAFCLLGAGIGLSFWVIGSRVIHEWFVGMSGSTGALALFGIIAVLAVGNQYMTALLNSVGRFRTIARINLVNLALIVVAGSLAFYRFGTPGLLLAIAAVYGVSVVAQGAALRQELLRSGSGYREVGWMGLRIGRR